MRTSGVIAFGVVVVVMGAAAPEVRAQQSSRSQPMFGGANADSTARESLVFAMSTAEAYDDNLQAAGEPVPPVAGYFTSLNPTLTFTSRGHKVSWAATAGSNFRYYNDVGQLKAINHSGGVGMSAQVTRRTGLTVNEAVSYAPAYLYGLFVPLDQSAIGQVIPPATDYTQTPGNVQSYASSTMVNLTQGLTRRSAFTTYSNFRFTDFVGDTAGFSNMQSIDAGARYSYNLGRDFKFGLDYTYRRTTYANSEQPIEQNLNGGIEYNFNRALRLKRTTFSFHVGPTAARGLLGQGDGRYLLAADAVLGQKIGRTWTARAGYHRGFSYIEGLPNPVFGNATTADVGGLFNRRTDFFSSLAYSGGDAAFSGSPSPFRTYAGDVRLRYALSHQVASYVEYFYYYYNFDQNLAFPTGIAHRLTRNGVRVGIDLWAPIMRHR